jgi:hypothetical protein
MVTDFWLSQQFILEVYASLWFLNRIGVGTVTEVSVAYSASTFRVSVGWMSIQSSSLRRRAVTH